MKKLNEFLNLGNTDLNEKLITFGGKAYPKFGNVVILSGGAGCFVGETIVKTELGDKKISELSEGELVWTINEETLEKELKPITDVHVFENRDDIIELELENGEIIRCTENHQFFVDGKWVLAKDLEYVQY
jgi:intein/homing endonuclease